MKQHKAIFIALIIVCMTALAAVLVSRKDLCEFRIRTGTSGGGCVYGLRPAEVRAAGGGSNPAFSVWRCTVLKHPFSIPVRSC